MRSNPDSTAWSSKDVITDRGDSDTYDALQWQENSNIKGSGGPESRDDASEDLGENDDFIFTSPQSNNKHDPNLNGIDKLEKFEDYLRFVSMNNDGEMFLGMRRKRGRGRPHTKKQVYSKELAALVGQANLAYTKKQYSEAVEILHKVVKDAPHAQQPWMTLGMIHEELGDSQKALQSYLVAAHMLPKDIEQWKRLGSMSVKLGHDSQALYCYSRSLIICSTDLEALHARSELFIRRNKLKRATVDLKSILNISAYDMIAIRRLACIYEKFNEPKEAIGLYEKVVLKDSDILKDGLGVRITSDNPKGPLMTYEDLLHMANLYIKGGVPDNTWEFLSECYKNITGCDSAVNVKTAEEAEFKLGSAPIEMLVRFGIVFLYLNNHEIAEQFINKLLSNYTPNLLNEYIMVTDAFIKMELYEKAIFVLEMIKRNQKQPEASISSKLAQCYVNINDLNKAVDEYLIVIEIEKSNHDAKLALARIYDKIGKTEEAKQIAFQVKLEDTSMVEKPRRKKRGHGISQKDRSYRSTGEVISLSNSTMRPDKILDSTDESKTLSEISELYQQAQNLYPAAKDHVSRAEYLKKAYGLIRLFQSIKNIHTKIQTDGNSMKHESLTDTELMDATREIEERFYIKNAEVSKETIAEFLELSRGFEYLDSNELPQTNMSPKSHKSLRLVFRNVTPEQWYNIFVQTAYMAAEVGKYDEAMKILRIASKSSKLFCDDNKRIRLRLHMICLALRANRLEDLCDQCRRLIFYTPLCCEIYRTYSAFIPTGKESLSAYAMSPSSKFFLRLASKPPKVLTKNTNVKTMLNFIPVLATIAMISYTNRSFKIAITYLLKAYVLSPRNYMINLLLGLSYLHLSSQRTTKSRELYIANAFTFLFQYYELRNGDQEACYNIARAFHHLGFTNLAIPYYEKVLEISEREKQLTLDGVSLAPEAAYNLSRIYLLCGSVGPSYALLSRYFVV